jgi:hypothetical protein
MAEATTAVGNATQPTALQLNVSPASTHEMPNSAQITASRSLSAFTYSGCSRESVDTVVAPDTSDNIVLPADIGSSLFSMSAQLEEADLCKRRGLARSEGG